MFFILFFAPIIIWNVKLINGLIEVWAVDDDVINVFYRHTFIYFMVIPNYYLQGIQMFM